MARLAIAGPLCAQYRSPVDVIRTLVFLALALVLIAPSGPAQASIGWCQSDPVVIIGDDLTDIILSAPADAPLKVTGPNEIVVTIPDSLSGSVVSLPAGFGKGESVTVVQSPDLAANPGMIEVIIQVFVPASDDTMPVRVEFAPRGVGLLGPARAEGVANTWITLHTGF